MKKIVSITAIAALIALTSCKSGIEKKADAAWAASQELTSGPKLMKQKEAYIYYKQAMEKQGSKVSVELKNNFLQAALARIEFIYDADGGDAQAIFFIREDIDKSIGDDDVTAENRDQYSVFIMKLANDAQVAGKLSLCMSHLETAIKHAANSEAPESMKADITKEFTEEQLLIAKDLYKTALKEKNDEDIIRAEYYAHVVLNYDSTNVEALKLLSNTRKKLVSMYTAFPSVITDKPDTALYKRIDTTDILMAIPTVNKTKSKVTMSVNIYNYSYNAIRLKQENFYLIDSNGSKYKAKSAKAEKELLDTEFETKVTLKFNRPSGKIKKLVYDSEKDGEKHFAPKYFF